LVESKDVGWNRKEKTTLPYQPARKWRGRGRNESGVVETKYVEVVVGF
jgi:hypothetical protein